MNGESGLISFYGITKDPETNNFMMVMGYASNGNLRQYLNNNFNSFTWKEKLYNLRIIIVGLERIHNNGLIHHDFHCGNILNDEQSKNSTYPYITDFGLCRPANEESQSD